MRSALLVLLLGAAGTLAQAQDAGQQAAQAAQQASQQAMQAAQQASQAAQQANQQAAQAAQQANQQAAQAAQQAANAASTTLAPRLAATPKFSVKAGTYSNVVTVRITDSTRDTVIYYTTDGWTPTPDSPVYRGPITVDRTTTVQAIAVAPYNYRSLVAQAKYVVNLQPSAVPAAAGAAFVSDSSAVTDTTGLPDEQKTQASDSVALDGPMRQAAQAAQAAQNAAELSANSRSIMLQQDTPVPLVFESSLTSKTAQVGDTIKLTVAEDLVVNGVVAVPKGTQAIATVVAINHTGIAGAPGDISFETDSMTVNGKLVKLYGAATREGQAHLPNAAVVIPFIGPFTALRHGEEAVIDKGTPFTAFVDSNTRLALAAKN